MTTIKKCKLWLISVLAVAFVSAFGLFLGTNFKVARAADETADTTFEMVGGTSLRLEGGGGIRFRVKMGNGIKSKLKEDATTLNFLIAPRAAFNAAEITMRSLPKPRVLTAAGLPPLCRLTRVSYTTKTAILILIS